MKKNNITDMRINFVDNKKEFNLDNFNLLEIDYWPRSIKITNKSISIKLDYNNKYKYARLFYLNNDEAVELIIRIKKNINGQLKGQIVNTAIVAKFK